MSLTLSIDSKNEKPGVATSAMAVASNVDKQMSSLKQMIENNQVKYNKLQEHTLHLESQSRRNNLRFEGIPETRGENCKSLIQDTLTNMDIDPDDIDIARVHRLGAYNPKPKESRPIIVNFTSFIDRELVWGRRSTLKGGQTWLNEDFPAEFMRRRKKLYPYFRAARGAIDPANPKKRVTAYLRVDKLIINSHTYTADRLDLIPDFVLSSAGKSSCKTENNITLFFSKHCPLSNFFKSDVYIEGCRYTSMEQYISYRKAMLFDEPSVAKEVMATSDPSVQKHKVRNLKKFNHEMWSQTTSEILQPALLEKFRQNDRLREALLATGDAEIAEASASDCLYGIGLSLNNPDAVNKSLWKGENLQGAALVSVREQLKS